MIGLAFFLSGWTRIVSLLVLLLFLGDVACRSSDVVLLCMAWKPIKEVNVGNKINSTGSKISVFAKLLLMLHPVEILDLNVS